MPIPGLKPFPERVVVNVIDKRIRAIVDLLRRLDLVDDDVDLIRYATNEINDLRGNGLSFPRFPANITFATMVEVVNAIALEKGRYKVFLWEPYWVPGTEPGSCTVDELDDVQDGESEPKLEFRMALFAPQPAKDVNPLLWFCGVPYDDKCVHGEQSTQLEEINRTITAYEAENDGYGMWTLTHRDFLVLYAIDLLMDVPAGKEVLSKGWMHTPNLGRKSVGGDSCVGSVGSRDGRAWFIRLDGGADDNVGVGVGLSAGKRRK